MSAASYEGESKLTNKGKDPDIEDIQQENARLRAAVEELSVLNDIATAVGSTSSLERINELIVHRCIKHLKVEQATITLLDAKRLETPFHTIIRGADTSGETLPCRLSAELTGWMLKNQKPLIINNLARDVRFQTKNSDAGSLRSVLSVPLMLKGRMIGLLNLFNKRTEGGFTDADARLLGIIATQSAQVIEHARLFAEEQALKLMREEMKLAYKIQMDLLPKEPPNFAGFDIAGVSIPAKAVGGDYFDFVRVNDDILAFCLGDVSGKGMPAALLMANLQATLRSQIITGASPKECLARANNLIYKSTDDDKFATLFYGTIDRRSHEIAYANAGHNYPLLLKAGEKPTRLEAGGLMLGCLESFQYTESIVPLRAGDTLLVYSDGITESIDANDEEYGEDRLAALFLKYRSDSAHRLIDEIVSAVRAHAGETSQTDDMTLLVIKGIE
ncbi:MAG: SpoIIE family protein phosphatase [Candidatus Krumholzibacteria bacterium]|nr:SpoIIE family protein phosphatase [Candidatus Krumholzibacteria bacterium]